MEILVKAPPDMALLLTVSASSPLNRSQSARVAPFNRPHA
jgi:hypothetical protein